MDPDDIPLTPEMVGAGREAFEAVGEVDTEQMVEIIFRAMAAESGGFYVGNG